MDNLNKKNRIKLAIKALSTGTYTSERQATKAFDIPRSTLKGRINEKKTYTESHLQYQRLSPAEKEAIVQAGL